MALYLFYTITENNSGREPPESIDLPDDEAAVEMAMQRLDRHPIEVWEHGDLVARLDPWLGEAPKRDESAKPTELLTLIH